MDILLLKLNGKLDARAVFLLLLHQAMGESQLALRTVQSQCGDDSRYIFNLV
jgi:hypothetical protein